jgi:hypothetical protein
LHGSGADAARGAGNKDGFAGAKTGAGQHVLGRGVGAREGGQFGIGKRALDPVCVDGGCFGVLGEGTVAFGPEIDRAIGRPAERGPENRLDQHPFADPGRVDIHSDGYDASASVGALNARE